MYKCLYSMFSLPSGYQENSTWRLNIERLKIERDEDEDLECPEGETLGLNIKILNVERERLHGKIKKLNVERERHETVLEK